MAASKFFTIATAIRVMILGGLLAILFVIVQSCQQPKTGLDSYASGSLRRLIVMDSPPTQPKLVFTDGAEGEITLNDFKGKTILVNVWATWCPPCIAEMPMLDALQKQYGSERFEVVTISADRTQAEAAKWLEDKGLVALPSFHDSSYALAGRLGAQGLPISVFYNPYGQEIARVSGKVDWMSQEAQAFIKHISE